MKKTQGVVKNCKECNKEFYVPKYRSDTATYCSTYCLNHGKYERHKKICQRCNCEFLVSNSRIKTKYCGELCAKQAKLTTKEQRRKQNLYARIKRGSVKSTTLRRYVFCHKDKRCEICNYNEYDFCLDIHHKDNNPEHNDIINLIVLCSLCHRKVHKGIIQCP